MSKANAHIRDMLIANFEFIQKDKMQDVPIINEALKVNAFGFERFGNFHMGVLLTPWFMNLLLVPSVENKECLDEVKIGDKRDYDLPGGRFEFILGYDESIGRYWACSLFSPVFEFADQATAEATALAVYEQVCQDVEAETLSQDDTDMQNIWEGKLPEPPADPNLSKDVKKPKAPISAMSRRDIFRGKLRETTPEQVATQGGSHD